MHVRSAALENVNTSLRSAAVISFLGFCACGFIVGAFISFSQVPWTVRGYPVLGLLGTAGGRGALRRGVHLVPVREPVREDQPAAVPSREAARRPLTSGAEAFTPPAHVGCSQAGFCDGSPRPCHPWLGAGGMVADQRVHPRAERYSSGSPRTQQVA